MMRPVAAALVIRIPRHAPAAARHNRPTIAAGRLRRQLPIAAAAPNRSRPFQSARCRPPATTICSHKPRCSWLPRRRSMPLRHSPCRPLRTRRSGLFLPGFSFASGGTNRARLRAHFLARLPCSVTLARISRFEFLGEPECYISLYCCFRSSPPRRRRLRALAAAALAPPAAIPAAAPSATAAAASPAYAPATAAARATAAPTACAIVLTSSISPPVDNIKRPG